jgi:amino acid adenylation domain-containing protein
VAADREDASALPPTHLAPGDTLHRLFLAQARRTPAAAALITASGVRSYAQVEGAASRLALRLRRRGFGVEAVIAICVEPSHELAVAILGVLLAGCAYLPLDGRQPAQRVARILTEARPVLVLSDAHNLHFFTDSCYEVELIGALLELAVDEPHDSLCDPDRNEYLAYVIYTSGSTGVPKGVEISHRAAVNTLLAVNRLCGVSSADRIFAVSPASFDLSVYDCFGIWAAGGAVVMMHSSAYPEPGEWLRLMERGAVTLWNSAPALLEMILERMAREPGAVSCLRAIRVFMLSGDRISPDLVRQLLRLHPAARVLAMGGATEASIWSVYGWAEAGAADSTFVPYGRALPGQFIRVLDTQLQEVAIGDIGQLYIGGEGLARGYRGRPDLTAAAFIADTMLPGQRLYATGDRVRVLPDGNTEFLGRSDGQVKIRGFRVEVTEVERALLNIQAIANAIVVCISTGDESRLCAYLVPSDSHAALDAAGLRHQLARMLPSYMIPEQFIACASLPLTANGKLARGELSGQAVSDRSAAVPRLTAPPGFGAARTRVIVAWREVLQIAHVDTETHFLDLGGNSLSAARIVTRLIEAFGCEFAIRDVFENPTLATLTTFVEEKLSADAGAAHLPHALGGLQPCSSD